MGVCPPVQARFLHYCIIIISGRNGHVIYNERGRPATAGGTLFLQIQIKPEIIRHCLLMNISSRIPSVKNSRGIIVKVTFSLLATAGVLLYFNGR